MKKSKYPVYYVRNVNTPEVLIKGEKQACKKCFGTVFQTRNGLCHECAHAAQLIENLRQWMTARTIGPLLNKIVKNKPLRIPGVL